MDKHKNPAAIALGRLGGRACWEGVDRAEREARMLAIAKLPRKRKNKKAL